MEKGRNNSTKSLKFKTLRRNINDYLVDKIPIYFIMKYK